MNDTVRPGLILIEGLPGSGKSTLAHFLARRLAAQGIACKWWYEEEAGHPLYLFHDLASLRLVLARLDAGNYRETVAAALERWERFAVAVQSSAAVTLIDSCLFGYLTWTLFFYDVPLSEIETYLARVEQIILGINPRLIYLYQVDGAAALRRIGARRGGDTEARLIRKATGSAYGKRRALEGFDGMVAVWQAYRDFTDRAFARITFRKLAVENSASDWSTYEHEALRFLDLPDIPEGVTAPEAAVSLVGAYRSHDASGEVTCAVLWEEGQLLLDGLSFVWPRNRLIAVGPDRFAVEAFPFVVTFARDPSGAVTQLEVTGPTLLSEEGSRVFTKEREER